MSDDVPTPPPLQPIVGDPEREAVATLRGYFYQVWQSVHAWVALRDGELLFLEKAEDFDLVGVNGATTVQVFDSEQTITLRTEKVCKSIANFWMHCARNPGRPIEFRFLTRARIGIEQGEPFGAGIAGLKLWSGPLRDDAQIARLGTFIAGLADIPADLQAFLRTAPPVQISERLLRPMHWDVENADSSFVEAEIRRMLAEFGAHQGVPYSDAVRVADRLYREVCTVASSSGDRVLTRARFLEIFEKETSERIPRQEALMLRRAVAAMGQVGPPAAISDHFVAASEDLQGPPPLPQVVATRDAFVTSLRTKLNSSGALVLVGSSGMGKTTLAKLIIAPDAAEWIWVRVGRANATALIQQLGRRIDGDPRIRSVALDDVDLSPTVARDLEEVLGGVLYAVTERRGRVLVTTQRPLPARLARFLGVSEEHTIAVPPLTEDEIAAFAVQLGCSDAELAKQWARIALIKTRGHPQLVAAHLTFLRQNNWPAVAAQDLVGPASAVVREQEDARQLLDALPPDERELIYRLSVFRNPFRADHARSVGGKLRPLAQPGSLFERLRGSWIEPLHHDYFRVSALIERAGEQVFAPDELRRLHSAIVEVARDCPPVSTLEAATAFHHAWLGRDAAALVGLVASFMRVEPAMFAAIAQNLEWFTVEALTPKAVLFTENHTLSLMLRMIQFRIAEGLRAYDVAGVVLLRWDEEATNGEEELDALGRVMLAVSAIGHTDVPVRPPALLRYFGYLLDAEHAGIELPPVVTRRGEESLPVLAAMPDLLSQLVIFVAARSVDSMYLEELLDALDTAPPELRERIFVALRRLPVELRMMVQKPWLTEDQRQQPDWPRCLRALHKAFALGLKWGVSEVSIAALRAITIITDEHLHQSSDALQLLERMALEAGFTSHLIEDGHATVLFNLGRYEEALAEWESALARWPTSEEEHDIADSLAARMAAISAARIDRWDRAAALFMEAQRLVRDAFHRPYSVGLLADAGFAYWRAGAFADSAAAFGQALAESEQLPPGRENFAAFQAHKILGHILLWLYKTITGESTDGLATPQAGMGSDMEKRERLLEIPDGEPDGAWLLFSRIHERLCPGVPPPEQVQRKLQQSRSTSIRFIAADAAIRRAFRENAFDDLPAQCMELTKAMIDTRVMGGQAVTFTTPEEVATGGARFLTDNRTVGVELFLAALLTLAGEQRLDGQVVAAWRNSARSLLAAADFTRLCDLVDRILALPLADATRLLRDQNTPRETRLLAILNVALSPEADAEELFYSHSILVDCFAGGNWIGSLGKSFARLVERSWRDQIRSPATLTNPRVSVPAITAACDASEPSLAKLAHMLLAASQAVRARIPQALMEKIRSLPDSSGANVS